MRIRSWTGPCRRRRPAVLDCDGAGNAGFPRPRRPSRPARGGRSLAHDARGKSLADDERFAGHRAARRSGIQLVERVPARRRARRPGDRLSAGDRPRRDLGYRPASSASRPRSPTRPAPSTTSSSAAGSATSIRASRSGRPTSISSAIRAGAAGMETYGEDPFLTGRLAVAIHQRAAGRRPEVPQDHRHGQTLRRAQRPGVAAPYLRRRGRRPGPARHVPAAVRNGHPRRRRLLGHVRL